MRSTRGEREEKAEGEVMRGDGGQGGQRCGPPSCQVGMLPMTSLC